MAYFIFLKVVGTNFVDDNSSRGKFRSLWSEAQRRGVMDSFVTLSSVGVLSVLELIVTSSVPTNHLILAAGLAADTVQDTSFVSFSVTTRGRSLMSNVGR